MYKDRYQSVLSEYEKFWERKNTERCILNITYSKKGAKYYRKPESLEEKWLDDEYRYTAYKHNLDNSGYVAEGIPEFFTNFGPGCLAACIGGGFDLAENTIWFDKDPLIKDWSDRPKIVLDEQSEMWRLLEKLQNRFAADPDVCFSMTDLGGILDVAASLRGMNELLYDLYDDPDEVKALTEEIKAAWFLAFDQQVEKIGSYGLPYNQWMNIPSAKPWYPLQCDFCYMISPAQFAEFALDDLAEQVGHMERSIYHLDGVGELNKLDMLLDIPGLTGIQWVAGAGQDPLCEEKWFDIYRKVQDKKKNLVLNSPFGNRDLAKMERFIKSIDPVGVYISTHCSSREDAEDLVEKVTRWFE